MKRIGGSSERAFLVLAIAIFTVFSAQAQTAGRTSTSIQLTVYVPPVLQLSLNFGNGGVTQINGYLGSTADAVGQGFALTPNSTFSLGAARLVSNLSSSYSIIVQSMNGGNLKNQASGSEISYNLFIGGVPAARYGDAFRMVSSIRTTRDGTELPVSIALGNIPTTASTGAYTDNLLFNVSAN